MYENFNLKYALFDRLRIKISEFLNTLNGERQYVMYDLDNCYIKFYCHSAPYLRINLKNFKDNDLKYDEILELIVDMWKDDYISFVTTQYNGKTFEKVESEIKYIYTM